MSTVDASMAPPTTLPRPPLSAVPTAGGAVSTVVCRLLLPTAFSVSGLRTIATANCPTVACRPLEYLATTSPPSASPTFVTWPAGEPSWVDVERPEVCANCVRRPLPAASYGLQSMVISAAPLARPTIFTDGSVLDAGGAGLR